VGVWGRAQRISTGIAAQGADLSKVEFIDELEWREIPHFTETSEEMAAVREVLDDGDS
jgi:hypothetical protein